MRLSQPESEQILREEIEALEEPVKIAESERWELHRPCRKED